MAGPGLPHRLRAVAGRRARASVARLLPATGTFTPTQLHQLRSVVEGVVSGRPAADRSPVLDNYATGGPSAQQAVDVFSGEWSSALPDELGVQAGGARLFEDSRITELLAWMAPHTPGAVLELGPLEGGHTAMLERAGATVHAVESNARAFLKCLVVKELLGLQRARFSRGDFVDFLRTDNTTYDLVLASGVLYHMVDPLELLGLVAARTDRLAIWTHYYDAATIEACGAGPLFTAPTEEVEVDGRRYRLHPRDYLSSLDWGGFCGGPETYARWMERDQILDALRALRFTDLVITHDDVDHANGPAFQVLASR